MVSQPDSNAQGWTWFGIGAVLLLLALTLVESIHSYYFCNDDNIASELPGMVFVCRNVWKGIVPEYNPYNYMGMPVLSQGRGWTYPPVAASYAIARHLLGNEYLLMEVFAAIHLAVAYGAMFVLARRLEMCGPVACLTSLSFVVSGAVLIMGRCWHPFLSMAALGPLLALSADRLRTGPVGWRWALGCGAVIGMAYHSGFPQLWFFAMLFFGLHVTALWAWQLIPLRRALWVLPAVMLGMATIVPLLYQQWRLSRDMVAFDSYGEGVGRHLLAFVLPYPLRHDTLPNGWGSLNLRFGGHFFYSGMILTLLFLAAVVHWLYSMRQPRRPRSGMHIWTMCAIVAFLFCLGYSGGLWYLIAKLPVGLKNHPFRVMPFFVLFSVVAGGLMLERIVRRFPAMPWLATAIGLFGLVLLFQHVYCARAAFYAYGFAPYPKLPTEFEKLLRSPAPETPYRNLFCAPQRSTDPTYAFSMPQQLPTAYELPAFDGYDPVVNVKPPFMNAIGRLLDGNPAEAMRAYGVRWLLVHKMIARMPVVSGTSSSSLEVMAIFMSLLKTVPFVQIHEVTGMEEILSVAEVGNVDPLCFRTDARSVPLPIRLDGRGIHADLGSSPGPGRVVVNFLFYPDLHAYADGVRVAAEVDEWGRMLVAVPGGTQRLDVLYQPTWLVGFLLAIVPLLLGLTIAVGLKVCDP